MSTKGEQLLSRQGVTGSPRKRKGADYAQNVARASDLGRDGRRRDGAGCFKVPPNFGCPGSENQQFAFWVADWSQTGVLSLPRAENNQPAFDLIDKRKQDEQAVKVKARKRISSVRKPDSDVTSSFGHCVCGAVQIEIALLAF